MSKSAMIRARIEPELKDEVESLFGRLGLTATEAINLFYRQVRLRKGLPFDIVIPNRLTSRTLQKSAVGKDLISSDTPEEMFRKLGI